MFQLNARISEEANQKLESIVEYYRSEIKIGRVSKGAVLEELINNSYEKLRAENKVKNVGLLND